MLEEVIVLNVWITEACVHVSISWTNPFKFAKVEIFELAHWISFVLLFALFVVRWTGCPTCMEWGNCRLESYVKGVPGLFGRVVNGILLYYVTYGQLCGLMVMDTILAKSALSWILLHSTQWRFFISIQESIKTKHPQLLYESKLYRILQGGSK